MLETIKDLYKFYINHPIDGLVEVYPSNSVIEWQWKKQKDQIFFRKELLTQLNFRGDDFKLLYKLDRSSYRCDKILIEIHRKCDETFNVYWNGYLALIDGDFNVDRCKVSIKPRIEDQYTCVLSSWNKEKDFIGGDGAPPIVDDVKTTLGTIEIKRCIARVDEIWDYDLEAPVTDINAYPPLTACLPTPLNSWYYIGSFFLSVRNDGQVDYGSYYSREVISTPVGVTPPGPDWVLITEGPEWIWARPSFIGIDIGSTPPLKNGRYLNAVIQFLVEDCGLTYVSDFFNSNPDNTHPTNFAYDYATTYLSEVVIYQKRDIKRTKKRVIDSTALDVQYATKAPVKLKDLLNWLRDTFNVHWIVVENTFRIEHYTYFRQNQNMIDLTSNNRIKGLHAYKYVTEDLPITEQWSWMETNNDADFDGGLITYSSNCSYDQDDLNEKEYPISKITTNISEIIRNPDDYANDGFVFVATSNKVIISSKGIVSGITSINMPLSLGNLIYYLHRHGRPQRSGNVNGTDASFFLTLPSRSQEDISVPICCDDLTQFDPLHKIKTQLGWGFIDSAKLSDPKQVITFNLLHE
jgi:hypothetical protein